MGLWCRLVLIGLLGASVEVAAEVSTLAVGTTRPRSIIPLTIWGLKVRRFTGDPLALGWQGPITDDTDNWSFWTAPLRAGRDRPRVPPGRFVQVQVRF